MIERITPDWIGAPAGVSAFSTTRGGGASIAPYDDGSGSREGGLNLGYHVGDNMDSVADNRRRLLACLPGEPAWLRQVHGTTVVDARLALDAPEPPAADASITSVPGVVCAVMTADCLPVLLCDTRGKVVGAAHAGWRGLAAGILENTVDAMRGAGAVDLIAWMGPAIGPQQFEVGADVRAAFLNRDRAAEAAFRPIGGTDGKYLADLYHLARLRLAQCGVGRIAGGGHCTVSETSRFFSYRREPRTGRMASLIWIK